MKGQKLYVRPATSEDRDEIVRLVSGEGEPFRHHVDEGPVGSDRSGALIGKLVGEIVAHLAYSRTNDSIRVESIYVMPTLRRKWIGRFMIDELDRMATDSNASRLEVSAACEAAEFFRSIGFESTDENETLERTPEGEI